MQVSNAEAELFLERKNKKLSDKKKLPKERSQL
jgi:hypothetical protein